MFLKTCAILLVLAVALNAKEVRIRNMYFDPILLSWQSNGAASAEQQLLIPGDPVILNLTDNWAGRIWADWKQCENGTCNLPITLVEFLWDPTTTGFDFYDISLISGFNMVVKVIPIGDVGNCQPLSCQANLLAMCPEENLVQNSDGKNIGCLPTPDVFSTYCPQAYVSSDDQQDKLMSCHSQSVEMFEITYG